MLSQTVMQINQTRNWRCVHFSLTVMFTLLTQFFRSHLKKSQLSSRPSQSLKFKTASWSRSGRYYNNSEYLAWELISILQFSQFVMSNTEKVKVSLHNENPFHNLLNLIKKKKNEVWHFISSQAVYLADINSSDVSQKILVKSWENCCCCLWLRSQWYDSVTWNLFVQNWNNQGSFKHDE